MFFGRRFRGAVNREFAFLVDEFGFREVRYYRLQDDEYVVYQNKTTAVTVILELSYPGLFVKFSRLIDGRIPPEPIDLPQNGPLDHFYLDDLVCLRAVGEQLKYSPRDLWSGRKLSTVIASCGDLVRRCGGDILKGDFSVFTELEAVVRSRFSRPYGSLGSQLDG